MTLAILTTFLKPVIVSVMSGIGAGLITSLKKTVKPDRPERIDPVKLARTGGAGLVVGLIAYSQGFEITADNYEVYATSNAFVVTAIESLFVYVKRRFAK